MIYVRVPWRFRGKCTDSVKFDYSLSGAEGNERGQKCVEFDYKKNEEDI